MPIAPLLQSFVKVGHQFEEDGAFGCAPVEPENFLLHALVWPIRLRHVAILKIYGNVCAPRLKEIVEVIDHGSFAEQLLKPIVARKIRFNVRKRGRALVSEYELNFSKLHRLKSRRGLEPVAEARE